MFLRPNYKCNAMKVHVVSSTVKLMLTKVPSTIKKHFMVIIYKANYPMLRTSEGHSLQTHTSVKNMHNLAIAIQATLPGPKVATIEGLLCSPK